MKLNCVIVVEGKSDQNLIKQLFDVIVITTNGSCGNQATVNWLQKLNNKYPIILACDPDYQGQKIMHQLAQQLSYCHWLNLTFHDLKPRAKKSGLAECDPKKLQAKIIALYTKITTPHGKEEGGGLNWQEYLTLKLNTKAKRALLCHQLQIPYANHKQLFKRLVALNYSLSDLTQILHA